MAAANECIENFLDSDLANLMLKSETTLTGSHVNRAGARKCFSYLYLDYASGPVSQADVVERYARAHGGDVDLAKVAAAIRFLGPS